MNKRLLSLFAFTVCVCMFSCSHVKENMTTIQELAIIPQPQEIAARGTGTFQLTAQTRFGLDTTKPDLVRVAQLFNQKISVATGFELPLSEKGAIQLELVDDSNLGLEGYRLEVKGKKVVIQANQSTGLFYGTQTLLQLLPPEVQAHELQNQVGQWLIPCVQIKDTPKYPWRGLMLDVSRHWFTKEEVKRFIDEMSAYKFNVFHWHLTDDQGWRIQIKSLPRLTEVGAWRAKRVGDWWKREPQQPGESATYGGFYTHEDIKEVVAYAKERHIRVIPEIDVPGHSLAALVAYPELACMKAPAHVNVGNKFYGEDENTLCAGEEHTFQFLDQVFTEVASLFPDEYIHIGGDECYKGFWHKCSKCQARMKQEGIHTEEELQSYFIHRLEGILKSKGKKLIGWDEIIEGGLAPDATVMSWRGMKGGIQSAKAGHHVIMTPTQHCYLDLYQGERSVEPATYSICRLTDCYRFNPQPDSVPAEMILGGQGNLWSEAVPTFRHAEYMAWPRGWALAEVLWSGPAHTDWNAFYPRVEQHFVRADQAGINYARSMYNAIVTPEYVGKDSLRITLGCELPGVDIYYTFDNTDPDRYTPKYQTPLSVPKCATKLRVITYRNGKPLGKLISLPISELEERAKKAQKK